METSESDGPNYGPGCVLMIIGVIGFLLVLVAGMGGAQ